MHRYLSAHQQSVWLQRKEEKEIVRAGMVIWIPPSIYVQEARRIRSQTNWSLRTPPVIFTAIRHGFVDGVDDVVARGRKGKVWAAFGQNPRLRMHKEGGTIGWFQYETR